MSRQRQGRRLASRRATRSALLLGGTLFALAACTPRPEPAESEPGAGQEPLPVPLSAAAVTGEVPADLLQAVIADLARQEGLAAADIEVERAEQAIWPDGALGCPRPDELYTHAEVPGYWIVLRAAGKQYDYRASARGQFRRCGNPFKRRAPVG